jgi:hypothetical protein
MKKLFAAALLLCTTVSYAQHQELHEDPKLWGKSSKLVDSSNKHSGFKLGTIHGNLRSFFSSNFNKNSDIEYAQAVGGGIQFISKPVYHVKLGASGFFVYDAFSTDLTKAHPLSGALNRYELGLFDITDPANKKRVNRIEELYLQYQKNKTTFTVGKQLINTPFINLQDGRMRPTAAQGLWLQHKNKENKWYAGWLNKFSPRSTVAWYNTGASIGLYSVGVNMDGTKSGYKNALESSGAALVGAELNILKNHSIQVSNLWVQNIFNSSLVQLDKTPTTKRPYYYGLQLITQTVVNNGGNNEAAKTYFNPNQSSLVMGARLGKKVAAWDYSLNYTRITKKGRYLMPREWGRDPFYTFLMGERNEGVGGVSAYVLKAKYKAPKAPLTVQVGAGYFNLPDVTNYALNKYALPSYMQYNLDVRYVFAKHLKGWEAQLIYFYKDATGNTYNNPKYYINKVDMGHFNFIVNFHF